MFFLPLITTESPLMQKRAGDSMAIEPITFTNDWLQGNDETADSNPEKSGAFVATCRTSLGS
jgi:hypothetical protein